MTSRSQNPLLSIALLLAFMATMSAAGIIGAHRQEQARHQFNPAPKASVTLARPASRASRDRRILTCIKHRESGGRYTARNGHHFGAYQFRQTTWDSAGGRDYDGVRPDKAPPRIQDKRARRLVAIRRSKGLSPFGKWTTARWCR